MDLVQACTLCIDVNWNELVCARALIPSAAKFAPARTKCAHKSLPTYFRLELCAFVSLMMGIQHAPGECGTSRGRSTGEIASICVQFNDFLCLLKVFSRLFGESNYDAWRKKSEEKTKFKLGHIDRRSGCTDRFLFCILRWSERAFNFFHR